MAYFWSPISHKYFDFSKSKRDFVDANPHTSVASTENNRCTERCNFNALENCFARRYSRLKDNKFLPILCGVIKRGIFSIKICVIKSKSSQGGFLLTFST